ncbi:hypothetical protein LK09_07440 [Microbacterium mangrovi]|uniref:Sodium:proton antiporter n=1 Tax=Microbacterium mangrovi TaxID=1348253 RepID=A0A0B2AAZ0_9MICO|nr:DUF6328 family protein [Microbacterium mangrovi]KHK98742.1 hypothetical protein LK09_07440 [Microbacterium mangrovi]
MQDPGTQNDGRGETPNERADRNWQELVQELRVTQTGSQILSGFLLTVAFQQSFHSLLPYQKTVYLVLVLLAAGTTVLGMMPVAVHRALFRRRRKSSLVTLTNRLLVFTVVLVATLTTGVVFFLFDVVASLAAGIIAAAVVAVAMGVWLLMFPLSLRDDPVEDERR